jgi:hypothetical protein
VDTTDTDIYASLAEQNPAQAAALQAVVVQMKLADKRAELFNDESTVSEEDNKAFDTEPAGADDDAEENEE